MADAIKSFMGKLKLWLHQLQKAELYHFPRLQSLVNQKVHFITKYQSILEMLFSEFETRFHDINDMNVEMLIFENPFAVKAEEAPLNCQLEIVDMQNNTRIRSSGKLGIELWRLIDRDEYPNLKNLVSRMLAMFGGTYICEQFFSVMNNNKNNRRSRISDSNLVATLRVSVSKLQPDIDRLVAAKTSKSPPDKTE
ncbi:hypothetical protein ANN_23724 [Periplaneta americana]|uniref:HAT C-terminal dimerisation domain-containing protein n=1 Tax=Periplaneta americana TaxID=6978 RepID=A0ABQ8SLW4_PERAM|nr:hypothetical protein ANN_23724 [Periplaneta americana]